MEIFYNNQRMEDGTLKASCTGFQYGRGVFETILLKNGSPCFLQEHYLRLQKSCEAIGLQLKFDLSCMRRQTIELSQSLGIAEGRLKAICFSDVQGTSTIMTLAPYSLEETAYQKGYSLMVSSMKRNPHSPISYIKSLNYLENILAREEAAAVGYDDALFLNIKDKLCESTIANLFWIKDNTVFTPQLSCGILNGITREHMIKLCGKTGLKLEEGIYDLEELLRAEEVFITNSLMGVMPVRKVNNTQYKVTDCSITNRLRAEYNLLVANE